MDNVDECFELSEGVPGEERGKRRERGGREWHEREEREETKSKNPSEAFFNDGLQRVSPMQREGKMSGRSQWSDDGASRDFLKFGEQDGQ